jgi:hypothetical protein
MGCLRDSMPHFTEGFEQSGINWEEFAQTLPALINTTTEAMIAEIVDNALDQNCSKIKIEIFGSSWEDLAIIIYDNGNGFIDEDKMDASFELSNRPGFGGGNSRIGKFNIGLKLTPLSRCNTVIAHSVATNGQPLYRCLDKLVIKEKGNYGTIKVMEDSLLNRSIQDEIALDGWSTAIAMTRFTRRPEMEGFSVNEKRKYGNHITSFLGLIYQKYLKENPVEIEMHGNYVTPKDPFWKNFTPSKINETLSLDSNHPDSYSSGDRYRMECLREWGTIATPPRDITIRFDGTDHIITVTGYSIPHTMYRNQIPSAYSDDCFWTGPSGQDTSRLRAKNLSGLYFYRNGRCVCFGNTGPDSNDGWYSLVRNVEPHHHITRFKVEYPEELDEWICLAPNKDRVNPPSEFFDKFKAAMGVIITEPELRGPLKDPYPFFVQNYSKKQSSANDKCLAGLNYKFGLSHIEKECPHCNQWHYKLTECPKKPPVNVAGGNTGGGNTGGGNTGGGNTGGGNTGGGSGDLPAESSHLSLQIGKVILKLVFGDETNEDKIQQARDYLNRFD